MIIKYVMKMDTIQKHLTEKTHKTESGIIHYWVNIIDYNAATLVFLPGLTSDCRLFEKQIEFFRDKRNVFVWNAPAHANSFPFTLDFDLMDIARWLHEILEKEKVTKPVIVGQSIGGHIGQSYAELFPDQLSGFVSINSSPLQKTYYKGIELWLLKTLGRTVKFFSWKFLLKSVPAAMATSEYGRNNMREIMMVYDGDRKRYSKLMTYGLSLIADAIDKDLPYTVTCSALLIHGEKDPLVPYDRLAAKWHERSGIPLELIKDASHNSNTDAPDIVNRLIEEFVINRVW